MVLEPLETDCPCRYSYDKRYRVVTETIDYCGTFSGTVGTSGTSAVYRLNP